MAPKRDPAKSTKKPSDNNTKTSVKAKNTVASEKQNLKEAFSDKKTKASVKGKNTVASDKKNLKEASSNKKEFKVATKNKSEKKKEKTVRIY